MLAASDWNGAAFFYPSLLFTWYLQDQIVA
jgi:hypothetical protein